MHSQMAYKVLIIVISCLCSIFRLSDSDDKFTENLIVNNFNNFMAFHFDFEITTSDMHSNHYHLFPRVISELVRLHSVAEMHLTMSRGFWDTDKWGYQPVSLPSEAAELWTWFERSEDKIDDKYDRLANSLSGLFCTSLNKLTKKKETVSPVWTYSPEGLTSNQRNNSFVRHSVLSGESLCTENLSPWFKLLPCKKWGGLSQLLKPNRLFSSHFLSVSLSLSKKCMTSTCNQIGWSLRQTVTLVLDRRIFGNVWNTWSLTDILYCNDQIESCPLAEVSRIYINGFVGSMDKLNPKPTDFIVPGKLAVYDLKTVTDPNNNLMDIKITGIWPTGIVNPFHELCPLSFTKFATGTGNVRGGIQSIIVNNSSLTIPVVYMDTIPWYFRFYFHTLRINADDSKPLKPRKIHYIPSLARERMTHLEIVVDIPPKSVVTIQYQFRKILLNWNEYPPDANHEFYIPSSSLTFEYSSYGTTSNGSLLNIIEATGIARTQKVVRLHSELVLVTMPCPDFSMPFNALCLACTVLAIMIGGIQKYTTTSMYGIDPENSGLKGKLVDLVQTIKAKLRSRKIIDEDVVADQ